MADAYVDENETIYYADKLRGQGLSANTAVSMFADINQNPLDTLISGQSTVFINSIKFKASAFIDPDSTDFNQTAAFMVAGIVPFDLFNIANGPNSLEDYQELKGWPLKGSFGYSAIMRPRDAQMTEDVWQGNASTFSWTKTYKPRKALLLSRMQSICFSLKNDFSNGSDFNYLMSMEIQMKRGD